MAARGRKALLRVSRLTYEETESPREMHDGQRGGDPHSRDPCFRDAGGAGDNETRQVAAHNEEKPRGYQR